MYGVVNFLVSTEFALHILISQKSHFYWKLRPVRAKNTAV